MTVVALLTPDPEDEAHDMRWPQVLARVAEPLRGAGIGVEARSWTAAGDLRPFPLVLPLFAWGYHRSGAAWGERLSAWERDGVKLANSAAVLRWNADKAYLGALAERGAPIVPSLYVERADEAALASAARHFAVPTLIAKPRVSAGAWRTIRWSPGAPPGDGPDGPAILQPYLPSIETEGEVSLLYFGGRFSHAIRKRPKAGDFRVQPEFDGVITPHQPDEAEREAAERVFAAIGEPLLYARIDLARSQAGMPLLMEAELVEPDFYLEHAPDRGAAFARSVREWIEGSGRPI